MGAEVFMGILGSVVLFDCGVFFTLLLTLRYFLMDLCLECAKC